MNDSFLNRADGSLRFSDTFSVSPATTPEMLATYFGNDKMKVDDLKNGWAHHTLHNVQVAGKYFIITFYFQNGVLKRLTINLSDGTDSGETGWENWNLDNEKRIEKEQDLWLTTQVGGKRKFDWGSVGSWFDERAAFSYISLVYAE